MLTIVELNPKYYKVTDNENLNILCEFLRIKNNKGLDKFVENHGSSEFGKTLYAKYVKVILDKDILEEVGKMEMYQEKMQLRYHTPAEAKIIEDKTAKKIAIKLLDILDVETIAEKTNLPVSRVKKVKEKHYKPKI